MASGTNNRDLGNASSQTRDKRLPQRVWLVGSGLSDSDAVSFRYEPDIKDMQKFGIESLRFAVGIGFRKLSDSEVERIPKVLLIGRAASGKVPAIIGSNVGPFIVSQTVRDIVEDLEPGVQKFHPINVRSDPDAKGRALLDLTYYILLEPPVIDCIDIDRTTRGEHGTGRAAFEKKHHFSHGISAKITLRRQTIVGHHFWRTPPFSTSFSVQTN